MGSRLEISYPRLEVIEILKERAGRVSIGACGSDKHDDTVNPF